MSIRPEFSSLESPALDADRDPPNLRRYPRVPAADDSAPDYHVDVFKRQIRRDDALRERLRHEQQDERGRDRTRYEPRDSYLAREYGVRRWGEL